MAHVEGALHRRDRDPTVRRGAMNARSQLRGDFIGHGGQPEAVQADLRTIKSTGFGRIESRFEGRAAKRPQQNADLDDGTRLPTRTARGRLLGRCGRGVGLCRRKRGRRTGYCEGQDTGRVQEMASCPRGVVFRNRMMHRIFVRTQPTAMEPRRKPRPPQAQTCDGSAALRSTFGTPPRPDVTNDGDGIASRFTSTKKFATACSLPCFPIIRPSINRQARPQTKTRVGKRSSATRGGERHDPGKTKPTPDRPGLLVGGPQGRLPGAQLHSRHARHPHWGSQRRR